MADIAFEKDLSVAETGIEGLKVVDLAVHGDSRGWFKENWQRAKMCALGIPDLRIVQNNISYNDSRGVTRGIHAEPWDKFISVARGSVFGAWVDLREGSETFGKVFTCTLDPSRAIYVPRGVGNSFQALEDGTAYTYLVDAHWSLELKRTYTFVNLADPELAIEWPIPLDEAMGHERSLKGIDVSVGRYSMYDRVEYNPPRTIWSVSREAKGAFGNWPRELAKGDTREEAIAAFKKRAAELLAEERSPTKGATFEIYGKRAGGAREFFIGKKIGRNVAVKVMGKDLFPLAVVHARAVGGDHVGPDAEIIANLTDIDVMTTGGKDKIDPARGQQLQRLFCVGS